MSKKEKNNEQYNEENNQETAGTVEIDDALVKGVLQNEENVTNEEPIQTVITNDQQPVIAQPIVNQQPAIEQPVINQQPVQVPVEPMKQQESYYYVNPNEYNNVPNANTLNVNGCNQKKSATVGQCIAVSIITTLLGVGIGGYAVYSALSKHYTEGSTAASIAATIPNEDTLDKTITNTEDSDTLAGAVSSKALPSVVSIYTYQSAQTYGYLNPLARDSANTEKTEIMSGLGSGVILSEDGYILTNNHVIDGSSSIKVKVEDTEYDAKVVGTDESGDIAVLKIEATGLTNIEIADSSNVKVGDWVMAIGSPYGYEKTVTTGIVSALNRSETQQSMTGTNVYVNLIQTDASINSGNSGGALVNSKGELIGINTLISSSSGSSAGIGFAIPSNYLEDVVKQIKETGTVAHSQLGVGLSTKNPSNIQGAIVESVASGSSADKAGIKVGDTIINFGGTKIVDPSQLVYAVREHSIGDVVKVEVQRGTEILNLDVTLAAGSVTK